MRIKSKYIFLNTIVWTIVGLNLFFPQFSQGQSLTDQINDSINQVVDQLLGPMKTKFNQQIEMFNNLVNTLNVKVTSAIGINPETKTKLNETINSYKASLEQLINDLKNISSKTDFQGLLNRIKTLWEDYQKTHKQVIGLIISGRFADHLSKVTNIIDQIKLKLNDLSDQGINVENYENTLNQIQGRVSEIQNQINQLTLLLDDINNVIDNFDQALKQFNQIKGELYNVIVELQQLIGELSKQI
jgi:DNA repair exonuclease SbcCD ATPase subunit